MGAKPRGVGRPRKKVLRVELRLDLKDAAMQALVKEAGDRGVTVRQHVQDILIARFLNEPIQRQEPEQQRSQDSASALADEYM